MTHHNKRPIWRWLGFLLIALLLTVSCTEGTEVSSYVKPLIFMGSGTGGGNPGRVVFYFALEEGAAQWEGTTLYINSLTLHGEGPFSTVTFATADNKPLPVTFSVERPAGIAFDPPAETRFETLAFGGDASDDDGLNVTLSYKDPQDGNVTSRDISLKEALTFELAQGTSPWPEDAYGYIVHLPLNAIDLDAPATAAEILAHQAVMYNDGNGDGLLNADEQNDANSAGKTPAPPVETAATNEDGVCADWTAREFDMGEACETNADCMDGRECHDGHCYFPEGTTVECQTDYGICHMFETETPEGLAEQIQCVCPGATASGAGAFIGNGYSEPEDYLFSEPLTQAYCEQMTRAYCDAGEGLNRSCDLDALCTDEGAALCGAFFDNLTSCYAGLAQPNDYLSAVCCEAVNIYGSEVFEGFINCMQDNACENWQATCFDFELNCEQFGGPPATYERTRLVLLSILAPYAEANDGVYPNGANTLRACGVTSDTEEGSE